MSGEWETGFTTPARREFHRMALAFGGRFHGPNVETLCISEQGFYRMMESLAPGMTRHALRRAGKLLKENARLLRESETNMRTGVYEGPAYALKEIEEHERLAKQLYALARGRPR